MCLMLCETFWACILGKRVGHLVGGQRPMTGRWGRQRKHQWNTSVPKVKQEQSLESVDLSKAKEHTLPHSL